MEPVNIVEYRWIICDKERTVVAKGVPRNRYLVELSDVTNKQRLLTYSSKKKAELGFTASGFFGQRDIEKKRGKKLELEAVKIRICIEEIGEKVNIPCEHKRVIETLTGRAIYTDDSYWMSTRRVCVKCGLSEDRNIKGNFKKLSDKRGREIDLDTWSICEKYIKKYPGE